MPKFLSVKSIVIAPPRTGRANTTKNAVTSIAQTNKGISNSLIPGARILMMVAIKLTAPKIEDAPARCNEKIAKSTARPD